MTEIKGMLFDARKTLTPEEAMHEECLRYQSQVVADRVLEPARQELASRIQEAVNAFVDRKKFLPDTSKDCYRNWTPFDVKLSFRGDNLLDFLERVDIEIQFIVGKKI